MKYFLIILFFLASCSPSKDFYKRKYPHDSRKAISEKRGLMILKNTQLGRNKHFSDKAYRNRLKKTYKKYHKK